MFSCSRSLTALLLSGLLSLNLACSSQESSTEESVQASAEDGPAEAPVDAGLEQAGNDGDPSQAQAEDSTDLGDPGQYQLQADAPSAPEIKEAELPALADGASASHESEMDSALSGTGGSSLYFAKASARISRTDRQQLKEIASKLKADRSLKITLTGHCDNRGSKSYNKRLAIKRAKAVRSALLKMGVKGSQVKIGKPQLAQSGDTEEQHAQNRRVEIAFP